MIDVAVLQIIKYKPQFDKVFRYIPQAAMDKKTKAIVRDFERYFKDNPEETVIDFPAFRSLFFTVYHKGLKDEQIDFYNQILERIEGDVSEAVQKNIVNNLLELEFATNLANYIDEYQAGEEIAIVDIVDNLVANVKDKLERNSNFEYADFEDNTVGDVNEADGYSWPIRKMNETYRTIQGGDQYIIAGRPGLGKTSFITHLLAHIAPQMSENKTIVWFNNESRRQRIMSRQIQSVMNMTNEQLVELKGKNQLKAEYIKVMGRADKIKVFDVHRKNNKYLEDIIESIGIDNIGAIVFDMLDNVDYPMPIGTREDQRLEQLYKWARELGVLCNCPTFPTSQVSNEGEGMLFPAASMLKDSKTGKQGATDGIIIIGKSDDPTKDRIRGLSMPKTKSKLAGAEPMRYESTFDEDRGRYL